KRAVSLGNHEPAAKLRLAELLIAQDQFEEAQPVLVEVLKDDPRHCRAVFVQARMAQRSGNFAEAKRLAEKAALDPRCRRAAYALLAQVHLAIGAAEQSRTFL